MKTILQIPGSIRSLLVWMLAILLIAGSLSAHSEPYIPPIRKPPPPPPPQPDPEPTPDPVVKYPPPVYELRWSWIHWWEANRELYLYPANQGFNVQDISQEQRSNLRNEAFKALVELLKDPNVDARSSAATALGRIGAPAPDEVLDALIETAENDPMGVVRSRALLAIGMIGGERSEELLGSYSPESERMKASAIIACGFLPTLSDELRTRLQELSTDSSSAVSYAAYWALSQHKDGITKDMAIRRIAGSHSPWLVSESAMSLGPVADKIGLRVLTVIASGDTAIEEVPVWQFLIALRKEKYGPISLSKYREWLRAHRKLFSHEPTPYDEKSEEIRSDVQPHDLPAPKGRNPADRPVVYLDNLKMVKGVEDIYMARLRASAAIALGHSGNQPEVIHALQSLVEERDEEYNLTPKCFALISLGQIGSKECLPLLVSIASDRDENGRLKTQEKLESPMRGFAAIGLGIYARPYMSDQGISNTPAYLSAIELLTERLLDKREKLEVRTACAVALGISGRTANLKTLVGHHDALNERSQLLGGYVSLARAMLGDQNLIQHIPAFMAQRPPRDETTNLISRRAAVLSLGVVGTDAAIPVLVRYYDEPYFVNREVMLALSLCNTEGVVGQILPTLKDSDNPYEKAYMAEIIGRLLEQQKPSKLSRFLIDSNFTMKNGLLEPYRRMSNPFMYKYLIPQFGEIWY